jgi:type IV secretion system protein VirB1
MTIADNTSFSACFLPRAAAGLGSTRWRLGAVPSAVVRTTWRLAVFPLLLLPSSVSHAYTLSIPKFTSLARQCGPTVATLTLAAIAKTESRFQTLSVSDNTTGRAHVYGDEDAAAAAAHRLIAAGHSVDLGIMQINSANLRRLGMSIRDALEPCQAIAGAASVLSKNYQAVRRAGSEQIALRDALSMYNTGNRRYGYRNGYVRRVELAAQSLMASRLSGSGSIEVAMRDTRAIRSDRSTPPRDAWEIESRSPSASSASSSSDAVLVF